MIFIPPKCNNKRTVNNLSQVAFAYLALTYYFCMAVIDLLFVSFSSIVCFHVHIFLFLKWLNSGQICSILFVLRLYRVKVFKTKHCHVGTTSFFFFDICCYLTYLFIKTSNFNFSICQISLMLSYVVYTKTLSLSVFLFWAPPNVQHKNASIFVWLDFNAISAALK